MDETKQVPNNQGNEMASQQTTCILEMITIFLVCLGCRKWAMLLMHQIPWVNYPGKGNLRVPSGKRKFELGGVKPQTQI